MRSAPDSPGNGSGFLSSLLQYTSPLLPTSMKTVTTDPALPMEESPAPPHTSATASSSNSEVDMELRPSRSEDSDLPELDVPPMRIVVLIGGTAGDVMPFIDMAQIMKERYGHVVRIASHGDLRAPIEKAGLRFYPLGGNAQQMAGWGPSFSLKPAILLKLAANPNTVHKLVVMRAVSTSCINACTMPDPADAQAEPFHADVVMANPMCLGHIHCAEGLGVPLHLFFPNPWVATTEYPHSFSGWDYPHKLRADPADGVGYDWVRKSANYYSYRFVDGVLWHVFLSSINELRAVCRLRTLRFGTFTSGTILHDNKVPFSQLWSPSLSARPHDWPSYAKVCGFFFWNQRAGDVDETSEEFAPLVEWLNAGEPPIYIGFGSMVFNGVKTAKIIVEAAQLSGKRVLMQSATAGGQLRLPDGSSLPPNVFHIGRCPHDWLMPRMAAVIHHGGAGTTGAGLRLGLPSMCCPFFGDQFFYGYAIAAKGAGPEPIPFTSLSAKKLAHKLAEIVQPQYAEGAKRLAACIARENGVETGLEHFNTNLPLADMVCDISTLLHEKSLGRHYYPQLRIKVSDEVHLTLTSSSAIDAGLTAGARPHVSKHWNMGSHWASNAVSGFCTGILAAVWELLDATLSIIVLPIKSTIYNGFQGFLLGLCASIALVLLRLLYAPVILVDRIATGCANCAARCMGRPEQRTRPVDHVLDPEPALTAIAMSARGDTLCGPPRVRVDGGHADGASRLPLHGPAAAAQGERRLVIEEAFRRTVALRHAFDALDVGSNDDALSASELATLKTPLCTHGDQPTAFPFEADRLPALANFIGRYLRARGKTHLHFTEFVLLCRDFAPNDSFGSCSRA